MHAMSDPAARILEPLTQVEHERAQRRADAALGARVLAVKQWQQRRFAHTYADLLASRRYGGAARFFLDELYGPRDFSERDAQFTRVVPALVRLFPHEIVATVTTLARLHALSERLDSTLARHLDGAVVDAAGYLRAWQATGGVEAREQQIALALGVGAELDRHTQRTLLRHALRAMRAPARAAGLEKLQHFLETGFDTFGSMRGASDFLAEVGARERALVAALFAARDLDALGPGRLP